MDVLSLFGVLVDAATASLASPIPCRSKPYDDTASASRGAGYRNLARVRVDGEPAVLISRGNRVRHRVGVCCEDGADEMTNGCKLADLERIRGGNARFQQFGVGVYLQVMFVDQLRRQALELVT